MNGLPLSPSQQEGSGSGNGSGIPYNNNRSQGATDVLRSKNKKRDEAIRRKVEQGLSRTNSNNLPSNASISLNASSSANLSGRRNSRGGGIENQRRSKGTVSSLRPNPAFVLNGNAKVLAAANLMAAKRTDAVLIVGEKGELLGILTDKDICFRVVAEGLDVRQTPVSQVMTPNPIRVYDKGSRNEALSIMISRKFRHLPVLREFDEFDDNFVDQQQQANAPPPHEPVVGLLDITKCVFERLEDLERKVFEDKSILNAMEVLERRGNMNAEKVDSMRNEHECPTIGSVLLQGGRKAGEFPSVLQKSTIREAAKAMKASHGTAVLVMGTPDGVRKVAGILTTKDIALRVIAASLDPNTTSVVRAMTPHPDFVDSKASILDALKKLHAGNFLHLPVIDDTLPVGLVDVMTLTITMLTYLVNKSGASTELGGDEGPMWNHFWNNTFAGPNMESDHISQVSEPRTAGLASSLQYSKPRTRGESPEPSLRDSIASLRPLFVLDTPFAFKLKDILPTGTGKTYRFSTSNNSLLDMYEIICSKTGYTSGYSLETPDQLDISTPLGSVVRLCYQDEDNDWVVIENDKDLNEAVRVAFDLNCTRLVIYLSDPASASASALAAAEHSRASSTSTSATPTFPQHASTLMTRKEPATLFESLKEAPLVVNLGLSAAVIVAAYYVIRKIG